jgi:hypothetical protein
MVKESLINRVNESSKFGWQKHFIRRILSLNFEYSIYYFKGFKGEILTYMTNKIQKKIKNSLVNFL